jgi:hypothetical protein
MAGKEKKDACGRQGRVNGGRQRIKSRVALVFVMSTVWMM